MRAWDFGGFDALGKLLSGARGASGDANAPHRRDSVRPSRIGPVPAGALGLAAGLTLGPLVYHQQMRTLAAPAGALSEFSALPFASISAATVAPAAKDSAADAATPAVVEPRTGLAFVEALPAKKKKPCCKKPGEKDPNDLALAGLGVRVKKLFGPAGIKVYAFGVYVDAEELKQSLGEKYKGSSAASLKSSKWLLEDLLASDCPITVRLIISYKGLKIGQVRSAFNDSVGGSLKEISGKPEPDLLQSFTKGFTDDKALQRGTVIDLRRTPGHYVTTEFDGQPAGSVKSSLLSRALFSLYLGEKSFDASARDKVKEKLAELLAGA